MSRERVFTTEEEVYRNNLHAIQTKYKQGRIQDLYNFELKGQLRNVKEFIDDIFQQQKKPFKINFAFGYTLQSVVDDKYMFYHPSNNNSFLPQPKLMQNEKDKDALIEMCNPENIKEFVFKSTFSSSWVYRSVVCIAFRVTKM